MTEGAARGPGLSKSFGHVHALRGVDFDVPAGSITGLVGDNGAGKSISTRPSGVLRPTTARSSSTASRSRLRPAWTLAEHGIETVYQDLALAPTSSPP